MSWHIKYTTGKSSKLNTCSETLFLKPVLEDEAANVIKNLTWNLFACIIEVPDLLVTKHTKFIKKSLSDIYKAYLELDIFPDRLKL